MPIVSARAEGSIAAFESERILARPSNENG